MGNGDEVLLPVLLGGRLGKAIAPAVSVSWKQKQNMVDKISAVDAE
jgi:hypothetical protein